MTTTTRDDLMVSDYYRTDSLLDQLLRRSQGQGVRGPQYDDGRFGEGRFDGRRLYRTVLQVLLDQHVTLVDYQARRRFVNEFEHKYDHLLGTEKGADKACMLLVRGLKQRFDGYMTPAMIKAQQDSVDGTLVGIGISIHPLGLGEKLKKLTKDSTREQVKDAYRIAEDNQVMVIDPMEGGPAERAGIRAGDRITKLDGVSVNGLLLNDFTKKVRGQAGSVVAITVIREQDGHKAEVTFNVRRAVVTVPDVKFEDQGGGISLIRVRNFSQQNMLRDMEVALRHASHGKGLIIDLRGNPGGRLDFVQAITSFLLPEGTLQQINSRNGDQLVQNRTILQPEFLVETVTANGQTQFQPSRRPPLIIPADMPIVVLVDGASASASEFLSGVVQKNNRATIIGTPTVGKGVGQAVIPLPYGRQLAVTCFEFLPAGMKMDWVGIVPDIEVARTENPREDDQLAAAVKEIKARIHVADDLSTRRQELRKKHEEFHAEYDRAIEEAINDPESGILDSADGWE